MGVNTSHSIRQQSNSTEQQVRRSSKAIIPQYQRFPVSNGGHDATVFAPGGAAVAQSPILSAVQTSPRAHQFKRRRFSRRTPDICSTTIPFSSEAAQDHALSVDGRHTGHAHPSNITKHSVVSSSITGTSANCSTAPAANPLLPHGAPHNGFAALIVNTLTPFPQSTPASKNFVASHPNSGAPSTQPHFKRPHHSVTSLEQPTSRGTCSVRRNLGYGSSSMTSSLQRGGDNATPCGAVATLNHSDEHNCSRPAHYAQAPENATGMDTGHESIGEPHCTHLSSGPAFSRDGNDGLQPHSKSSVAVLRKTPSGFVSFREVPHQVASHTFDSMPIANSANTPGITPSILSSAVSFVHPEFPSTTSAARSRYEPFVSISNQQNLPPVLSRLHSHRETRQSEKTSHNIEDLTLSQTSAECTAAVQEALRLARELRAAGAQFTFKQCRDAMELYDVLGLQGDNAYGLQNNLQRRLRRYRFPPPNMENLRQVEVADTATLEYMLGKEEMRRRIKHRLRSEHWQQKASCGTLQLGGAPSGSITKLKPSDPSYLPGRGLQRPRETIVTGQPSLTYVRGCCPPEEIRAHRRTVLQKSNMDDSISLDDPFTSMVSVDMVLPNALHPPTDAAMSIPA